jgi:hypothetical protein
MLRKLVERAWLWLVLWTSFFPTSTLAGPTVVVGEVVPASARIALPQIRHDGWNDLLQKYVDDQGLVDYAGWQASSADQDRLDLYLRHLSSARLAVGDDRALQLAFWINAYNAVTIKGILREYPTTSIRNHTAVLWGYNIWKDLKLQVGDRQYSLEAMEHRILRKLQEPRIHFAIVCASRGCPRLLNEAYTADEIDEQLARNAKHFFADSRKFRFDVEQQTISVSPILKWFAADFGRTTGEQLDRIAASLPVAARELVAAGKVNVSYLDYDWSLNDRRSAKP